MEGLEHLGQYVFEMTNSKIQQLRAERGLGEAELITQDVSGVVDGNEEEEGYIDAGEYLGPEDEEEIEEEIKQGFEAGEDGDDQKL